MKKLTPKQKQTIEEAGIITSEIRKTIFDDCSFLDIRNTLEVNGFDRHLSIELTSTEVAIITPSGILMQSRASDNGQLGMWGGVVQKDEDIIDGAIREVYEETKIHLTKQQLEFVEINEHFHQYANGDKVLFKSYRFVVKLDYVPQIQIDEESVGACFVKHTILTHQQAFIKRLLGEI